MAVKFGEATTVSGEKSFESIKKAAEALKEGKIDVLVTAPINKASIQEKANGFIGHTEFLQGNFEGESLMVMVSELMRIAFVTGHVPLTDVKNYITADNIINKTQLLNTALIQDFGIRKPKIAILGLNPHAGEGGLLGAEENETITPTVKKLKEEGIMAFGPYPSDSFFTNNKLKNFDGILSMYHDQGLTAFKTLSFDDGINFTAGLNIGEIVVFVDTNGTQYPYYRDKSVEMKTFTLNDVKNIPITERLKDEISNTLNKQMSVGGGNDFTLFEFNEDNRTGYFHEWVSSPFQITGQTLTIGEYDQFEKLYLVEDYVLFDDTIGRKIDTRESRMKPKTNDEAKKDSIDAKQTLEEETTSSLKIKIDLKDGSSTTIPIPVSSLNDLQSISVITN